MGALIFRHLGWIQFIFRLEVTLFIILVFNVTHSIFVHILFQFFDYVYLIFSRFSNSMSDGQTDYSVQKSKTRKICGIFV